MSGKRERSPELEEFDNLASVMWASPTFVFQFHRLCDCHTLPLFGKSLFGIISIDFLYDSFTRALLPLSFPVSAFTLIPSTISHL